MLSLTRASEGKKERKTVKSLISDMLSIIPSPEFTREMGNPIQSHQNWANGHYWAKGKVTFDRADLDLFACSLCVTVDT
jgi:hypothetical protein